MAESQGSASPSSPDPFEEQTRQPEEGPPLGGSNEELSLVLDVARMWLREHQKTAMLTAFAVGVFTGSWLRE